METLGERDSSIDEDIASECEEYESEDDRRYGYEDGHVYEFRKEKDRWIVPII